CTGVSLAHGSNDGQKGIGLFMLILMGILPAHYALNARLGPQQFLQAVDEVERFHDLIERSATTLESSRMASELLEIHRILDGKTSMEQVSKSEHWRLRSLLLFL